MQRRREIVQGLWLVIFERGMHGVSFRTVAEAAGVSIGRVQHYFTSKDELVLEGCRQLVQAAVEDHAPAGHVVGEAGSRARDELVGFLTAPLPTTEPSRVAAAVWEGYRAQAVSDPAIAAVVTEAMRGQLDAVRRLAGLARGADVGLDAARRLSALADGLAQQVLLGMLAPQAAAGLIGAEVDRVAGAQGER